MGEVLPGVWVPMDGVSRFDPLQGGFDFCAETDGGQTYHPGCDLNAGSGGDADLGLALRMPVAGEVVYVGLWDRWSTGYGHHLWLRLETGDYLHYAHCDAVLGMPGQRYGAGTPVATCGKSGNQVWCHLHLECRWEDPGQSLGYDYWPYGQSERFVREHYLRPADWWATLLAVYAQYPEVNVSILTSAQQEAVQAAVWGRYWQAGAADFAIPASWRDEWKAGRWRGAPAGAEQLLPEDQAAGKPGGSFQVFAGGCAAWLPGEPVSWEG